jgi:hypothetical protein
MGETRVTLLTWISCMCRKFLFYDMEQLEVKEWRSIGVIYQ